jgi:hypothetical protein
MMDAGYFNPQYCASLREFGEPVHLQSCDGWVLERSIPGSELRDAMGPYPLFCCRDWTKLKSDLDGNPRKWVSFCCVPDPFGGYSQTALEQSFDKVVRFKNHLIVDYNSPLQISQHHRYYAKRALKQWRVELCPHPEEFLDAWLSLYKNLIEVHRLEGIKAFSRAAFEAHLKIPGLVAFRAEHEGEIGGMHLWYVQNGIAYSHLAASSATGYKHSAPYALYSAAIEHFAGKVKCIDLGAGSGTEDPNDGLTLFKRGWSNAVEPVFFCARILDAAAYDELTGKPSVLPGNYFPAYRKGL